MKEFIEKDLTKAIRTLLGDETRAESGMPMITLVRPPEEKFGDYTSSVALALASKLKKSPMEIARQIVDAFVCDAVERVEIVSPGHLNFYISAKALQKACFDILEKKESFGNSNIGSGKRALVEFISSNPTGPIHLGNARGGPAGDTLAHVLEKVGYKVSREFYVNDFGNQIMILGHSVLGDEHAQYRGDYVSELARRKPSELSGNVFETGRWAAGEILNLYIKPTCEKLGIFFDDYFSEKSLHDGNLIVDMLRMLREKSLTYEDGGALWFHSKNFGDDKDRVLVKSDGKCTYTLADFAYHKNKMDRGFDKLVTFLGADHHSQAKVMQRFVSEVLGHPDTLDIVITQMVRILKDGQELKMSKRKGVYYALDDLLEEVGKDAVRFIFVSYASTSHINFDINLALEHSDKNPVYYVQYAHARLASILRKAQETGVDVSCRNIRLLTHGKEVSLLRELGNFPELIESVAVTRETHRLPRYAITLADKFHSFYGACRVVDIENRELSEARLALCVAVKTVLAETLRLVGVSAPEKM